MTLSNRALLNRLARQAQESRSLAPRADASDTLNADAQTEQESDSEATLDQEQS